MKGIFSIWYEMTVPCPKCAKAQHINFRNPVEVFEPWTDVDDGMEAILEHVQTHKCGQCETKFLLEAKYIVNTTIIGVKK